MYQKIKMVNKKNRKKMNKKLINKKRISHWMSNQIN